MGFEILRTIPSLGARAIGELKSIGMIREKWRDVKVKSFLRGMGFWQRDGRKEWWKKRGGRRR